MTTLSNTGARAGGTARTDVRMIGDSIPIMRLRNMIARIAATDAHVLITGETGSGKEVAARMIHAASKRAPGPFVAVNCAALPESLFQAEVFGYEKGAFTDAHQRNAGRIDAARRGSLFLDEIGDLSLDMQVVLLRFLEEGVYERLGSVQPIQSDARIIAATHTDLKAACRAGRFREDLYYRLTALSLRVPPLRHRGGDIIALAEHFMAELSAKMELRNHELSPGALEALCDYDWPGNVRELRNRILQALVVSENRQLMPADLGLDPATGDEPGAATESSNSAAPASLKQCRVDAERNAIERALAVSAGEVDAAARRLDISRAQLYRLLKLHGLKPRRG